MNQLNSLSPAPLWNFFNDICKIPHLSKNEAQISSWLKGFAAKHKLACKEDEAGNLLIIKNAYPGFERKKTVVLQSHMDMVGEKDSDTPHNWATDPIIPIIEGDWVTARGTTLGADDGIGIAAQLAILSDADLKAGKIECLFTVDEESGMTGARNLEPGFFEGKILINLDSEDEGILFIGCAGGIDTVGIMDFNHEKSPTDNTFLKLSLTGLTGGHSGDEIHKGFANAIKQMARLLKTLADKYDIQLARFDGGNLRNGIPRESFALISAKPNDRISIIDATSVFLKTLKNEFNPLEPAMNLIVEDDDYNGKVMSREDFTKLTNLLYACPHGVISWSKVMDDLVETSTNLAVVKTLSNNKIEIVTTQRSSVRSGKDFAAGMVSACMELANVSVTLSEGYPGWEPNINSEILNITKNSYKRLFNSEPEVKAIHAGLECGLFYEKIPELDMISFGPTIKGAHTPEERIEISTTTKFWELLVDILEQIPELKP